MQRQCKPSVRPNPAGLCRDAARPDRNKFPAKVAIFPQTAFRAQSSQQEIVGIAPCGKFRPEPIERFPVEPGREDPLRSVRLAERRPLEIDDRRIAGIMVPRIVARAVDADDITLVLDRPGPQQGPPHLPTRRRPRGHAENRVVIAATTTPDRKTQVVTDERQKPQSAVFDHYAPPARHKMRIFAADRKKMPLVVSLRTARRPHEEKRLAKRSPLRTTALPANAVA